MPSICTLYPNRLTIYPEPKTHTLRDRFNKRLEHFQLPDQNPPWLDNFKITKKSLNPSKATKSKIFQSVNSMFALSKPRTITMKTGKRIFNFRMAFITLTLPAEQFHTDIDLKNKALNQLLVELRKHYKIDNYVWKAELQRNGNIHFHIITDRYVDYQALRRRWNRILSKLGYIDLYQRRFSEMSLSDYHKLRTKSKQYTFESSAAAYAQGKKTNWKNPNSVDVKSVNSKRNLAGYLAKYIAKDIDESQVSEEYARRVLTFGRSFGRSQSLSRLKYQNKFLYDDLKGLIEIFKNSSKAVREYKGEWCTVYYFHLDRLDKKIAKWINQMVRINATLYDYPFPIPISSA